MYPPPRMNDTDVPLQPRKLGCPIPFSHTQSRIWRYKKREGSWSDVRVCTTSVRISGPLDESLLRECIELMRHRHESLRTRLVALDAVPHQEIDEPSAFDLDVIDLSNIPSTRVEEHVRHQAEIFVKEKIDLSVDPLFAAKLYRLSPRDHVLVCALNHMVADGTSLGILDSELWTLYRQRAGSQPFSLPELPVQFADYSIWQRNTYESWLKDHGAYWRERLGNAPRVRIRGSKGLSAPPDAVGVRADFGLGRELSDRLREVARSERVLLPVVALTLYIAVTARWSDLDDVVLTFISAARFRPELRSMIGYLACFLHLRVQLQQRDTYRDLLRRVNREFYSALSHDDTDRVPDFIPEWDFGATDMYFNWVPNPGGRHCFWNRGESDEKLRVDRFALPVSWPVSFLSVFYDWDDEIVPVVHYLPDLFSPETVECFGRNLRSFASELAQNPGSLVARYET
jgi:condensation domain-containing protein